MARSGAVEIKILGDNSGLKGAVNDSQSTLSKFGGAVGGFVVKAGAALAGVGVAAGALGIRTAAGMEQAQISFETMLGSATKAQAFLKDLAAFAAKTPFDMPGLQTASQSLISAGVDVSKVIPIMTTLGDVTAGMGTGAEGIKRATVAIQQMNAAQRISGEDLNQLRDAGIPVYDLLSSALGKTKGEVVKLAQSGKLGQDALAKMMSALESGKGLERFSGLMDKQSQSLSGLWSTLKDTFSQGTAQAIQPFIPLIKDGLGAAIAFTAEQAPKLAAGAQSFATALSKVDWSGIATQVKDLFSSLTDSTSAADFGTTIKAGLDGVGPVVDGVSKAVGFLADHADSLATATPIVLAAVVAFKSLRGIGDVARIASTAGLAVSNLALASSMRAVAAAEGQANVVANVGVLTRIRSTAATIASTVASTAANLASKAWAAGQWLLNAALYANPIGLVVLAIGLLVAAIVVAWKNSETFRNIVLGAWGAIKDGIGAAVDWIKSAVTVAFLVIKDQVTARVDDIKAVLNWFSGLGAKFAGWFESARSSISTKIDAVLSLVKGLPGKITSALGDLGGLLSGAGKKLIDGLIDGITSKISAVKDAIGKVASAVKGFFPGSPVKEGPLTSWNRGGAGVRLGSMLADGLRSSASQVAAASAVLAGSVVAPSLGEVAAANAHSTVVTVPASAPVRLHRDDVAAIAEAVRAGALAGTSGGMDAQAASIRRGVNL